MFIKEPIRKRGYYRALRAKKHWAILKKSTEDLINILSSNLFDSGIINPIQRMTGLEEAIKKEELDKK